MEIVIFKSNHYNDANFIELTELTQNRNFRKQFIISNKFNIKRQTTLFTSATYS